MNQTSIPTWAEILLLSLPFLIGVMIVALNNDAVNTFTEKVEGWFRKTKERNSRKEGKFSRFAVKPLLWLIVKFCDWTDAFSHRGLKNGTRVSIVLYLVALWVYLIVVAFVAILVIVVSIFLLGIILKILTGGDSDSSSTTYHSRRSRGSKNMAEEPVLNLIGVRNKRIFEGTNLFNEEMKGRVDDNGVIYRGTNWINEERIGRIDEDGSIYRGTNVFNETKVGRIEQDGKIYKGSNWFNEERIGRIEEDGTIKKGSNSMNEEKHGRVV